MRAIQMFWWFERNGQHSRVEVLQLPTGTYELRVLDAEGAEDVETFVDSRELANRQHEIQERLHTQGWSGPHGWVV
jgi:hypothetical protein